MPQQEQSEKLKPCWDKKPPECPVRNGVWIGVVRAAPVKVGSYEGCVDCARIVVGGHTIEQAYGDVDERSVEAGLLDAAAKRIQTDVAIGALIRKAISKNPLLAKLVEALAEVLVEGLDGEEKAEFRTLTSQR